LAVRKTASSFIKCRAP